MSIDWNKIREAFPACKNQSFLMTGSIGPIPTPVYKAYNSYLQQLHETGETNFNESLEAIQETRTRLAQLLNASPQDIGLGHNTSHNFNLMAMMLDSNKGPVLMPEDEFPSTAQPWYHHGFQVQKVPTRELIASINAETNVVVTSAVQFASGYRSPLAKIGAAAAEHGIPFIVNATQALGAFPIDVQAARISALSATCHKWMCSGWGVAVFYTSANFRQPTRWPLAGWLSVEDPMAWDNGPPKMRPDTSAIETGSPPMATIRGLRASLKHIQSIGVHNIGKRILELSNYLEKKLRNANISIVSERDSGQDAENSINSGTILVQVPEPDRTQEALAKKNIFVTARRGFLRFTVHYFNNETDIDRAVDGLKELDFSSAH